MASRYGGRRARRSADIKSVLEEPEIAYDLSCSSADLYLTVLQDSIDLKATVTRRLSQLNFLARLPRTKDGGIVHGDNIPAIIRFAMFLLCDQCKEIRAATFRLVRVSINTTEHCALLEKAHLDFYIARALDLALDNEVERMQVIFLIRRIICLGSPLPPSIINALTAIASDGEHERERMSKICLEILCESLVLFPRHSSVIPILRVLMDFLVNCNSPPLSTAVVAAVMHFAGQASSYFPANLCDITQILYPVTSFEGADEATSKPKELTLVNRTGMIRAAKYAIVSALRTFEGIYLLSVTVDGIQSLLNVLHFNDHMTQEAVLDILSELLYLSGDVEPGRLVCDSWALQENFVADEARAMLPHVGRTRLNLSANYLSLLLFVLFQNGLVDSLIQLITSESPFNQRAFRLLNSYLSLASVLLPAEFTTQIGSLPSLISLASSSKTKKADSMDVLTALLQANSNPSKRYTTQSMIEAPMSLFLQHIVDISQPSRPSRPDIPSVPDSHMPSLRQALTVMTNNESVTWNWPLIAALLKAKIVHASDPTGFRILHRLLVFFKASNKLYSVVQRKHDMARVYASCALHFMEVCMKECRDLVEELLGDFQRCLRRAVSDEVQNEVILSPLTLASTCSSDYFVLVGRVSAQDGGELTLEKTGLVALYRELLTREDVHESYVKLVVSTLDYGRSDNSAMRSLLRQAAKSDLPAVRCYVTMHLRTLLRAGMAGFSQWGMDFLRSLLQDANVVVARTAAEVLDEACDEKQNLDVLIARPPPSLDTLPLGSFLTARILGSYSGFQTWQESVVTAELNKWRTSLNAAYVHFVEKLLSSKLLRHDHNDGTSYRSYSFGSERMMAELLLPEHLYGQLVQHPDGCDLIREEMVWLSASIKSNATLAAADIKLALWAVGHIGRTTDGMALLNEFQVVDSVLAMVAEHDNLSVRGTAFLVVGLWSVTERGADLLKSRDWLALRHDRHQLWPLVDQRVSYSWADSSAVDTEEDTLAGTTTYGELNTTLSAGSSSWRCKQMPARLLSYVSDPDLLQEHRPDRAQATTSHPITAIPLTSPSALSTVPTSTFSRWNEGWLKGSRGESGFESADGLTCRESRSDSAKTNTSDWSLSPPRQEDKSRRPSWKRAISSTTEKENETKKGGVASVIKRSHSTFHRSMEDGLSADKVPKVSGIKRSESRPSFREMAKESFRSAGSILDKMRKRSSHANMPYLLSTVDITSVQLLPSGEPSAKEERFMGICLPLKRSIWQRRVGAPSVPVSTPMNQECLHGCPRRRDEKLATGLDIHTVDKCLTCSIAGCDLSTVPSTSAPIVLKRKEVLAFVNTLATPLGHKAAEQGMLQLKNLLPDSYMDVCLYSEVCHLLASYQYKLSIRRLIQELFQEVPVQKCLQKYYERDTVAPVPEATEITGVEVGKDTEMPSSPSTTIYVQA